MDTLQGDKVPDDGKNVVVEVVANAIEEGIELHKSKHNESRSNALYTGSAGFRNTLTSFHQSALVESAKRRASDIWKHFRWSWTNSGVPFRQASIYFLVLFFASLLLVISVAFSSSLSLAAVMFRLLVTMVALGVSIFHHIAPKPGSTSSFSYGYGRFQVLFMLCDVLLMIFVSFFVFLYGLLRLYTPIPVNSRILLQTFAYIVIGFGYYLKRATEVRGQQQQHVLPSAGAPVVSISHAGALPKLHNSFFSLQFLLGDTALFISVFLVKSTGWARLDALLAMVACASYIYAVLPLFKKLSMILLQATPTSMLPALDKCLREASAIEGVLEVRETHVWVVEPGNVVGSLIVRVRRDAEEQAIRYRIIEIFGSLIAQLTIQVEKDDWY